MTPLVPSALAVLSILATAVAYADDPVVVNDGSTRMGTAKVDFARLKPLVNKLAPPNTESVMASTGPSPYAAGVKTRSSVARDSSTRAFGSFGIPYTTSRVMDGATIASGTSANSRLSTTYPYRTAGKLTFMVGNFASWCSATLILRSVIVTAAHCIQNFGDGTTLFTNFQFRPGHYGTPASTAAQKAPYGTWNWGVLVRPGSWSDGTDVGSGSARDNDLAVIALQPQNGVFVGDLTGWLSYGWNNYSFVTSPKTGNLHTAAVTSLGYPGLMDEGDIMQRSDGPAYTTTVGGSGQLWQGSNFTGGSSGGAWIVNMRTRPAVLSGGAVAGTASDMAVIGVTSWGTSDPNGPKDNYASQFRQNSRYPNASYGVYGAGNIASLINTLCIKAAPGGGTYASKGYCD